MRFDQRLFNLIYFMLIVMVATARDAHAYLDPGTGSYILQLVLAALLGTAFAVKLFWLRIKTFFANLVTKKPRGK